MLGGELVVRAETVRDQWFRGTVERFWRATAEDGLFLYYNNVFSIYDRFAEDSELVVCLNCFAERVR